MDQETTPITALAVEVMINSAAQRKIEAKVIVRAVIKNLLAGNWLWVKIVRSRSKNSS